MRRPAMFSAFAFASILTGSLVAANPASAARIIVTVDGVHSMQGGVYVGLYATPSKFLNGTQVDVMRKVRASTGPITVVFDNLPPGTYAVGAYHDENSNDHMDTDFVGLPTEGYALSNGVRAVLSNRHSSRRRSASEPRTSRSPCTSAIKRLAGATPDIVGGR